MNSGGVPAMETVTATTAASSPTPAATTESVSSAAAAAVGDGHGDGDGGVLVRELIKNTLWIIYILEMMGYMFASSSGIVRACMREALNVCVCVFVYGMGL